MASSSSSSTRHWKYDVFLSFRGPDTRKGIAVEIHDRLNRSGIKTFMDNPVLQVGDTISPTLMKAIQDSRFAIVLLSQNYASSTWCLEELGEICRSMEDNRILPLFYEVEPTDVRYQKRKFEEAFSKHEISGQHESDKVKQWRADLHRVANISGWNTNDHNTYRDLIDDIVEYLRRKVPLEAIESTEDFQKYEATTQAMDKVKKALVNDEITSIGVYGMGGVGKTSMVKHVAAQACKNGTFNHWIIAAISQSLDLKRIQGILADFLGVKFEEETEDGRAARLHKEIMRREKLLIIVDDVWERTNLSSIGIPSYKELQMGKSKVLVTTRRFFVCNAMKCHEKIALNVLSEKDSWTLFLRNAGTTPNVNVARSVAAECKGLPIALIVVARALRDEDKNEWEKAAGRLENSQHANPNHEEDEENAFKCIRLSYDYLKNEDHKSCFLLCCLFPEDDDIVLEDLYKYAFGKGLFGVAEPETTIEKARGTADSVVKYLKSSSLLLDSKKKGCVKMHDVIRDTALNIAQSEDGRQVWVKAGCGLKDWPLRGLPKSCTAISVMRNRIRKLPEEELVCPDLQILLLNSNFLNEIPEKFLKNLILLRVLDLSFTEISVLPQSFSLLINLQALYLDYGKQLNDISIVGSLKKLEILSMRQCSSLRELSREIGHLTNLRILDVSCDECLIPSKVISKLHKLEELYILKCGFEDWGSKLGREGEETELSFAGLPSLKILQACISDAKCIPKNVKVEPDWDYFYLCIGNFSPGRYSPPNYKSRSLVLDTTMRTFPDWFINTVTKKTEKLEYIDCSGMSDLVLEYDRGRLHKLKYLTVRSYSNYSSVYLKELMNTTRRVQTGPVFENLEELHLYWLGNLEELCVGELLPGSLFNLKVFSVARCFMLKNVSKFVQRLPNLEKLYLKYMQELEYVFRREGFEPEQPKLREMYLKALKSICNGPAPHAMFQSLKILIIYDCHLLQSLFTSDVAQCLVQLEDLLVERCPWLERVMEAMNNEKTVLPKLKKLVLKHLPMLYGPSATTVDIECPSLEHLIVADCTYISFSTSFGYLYFFSESRNRFSNSASKYFGSRNTVQLNDYALYKRLYRRLGGVGHLAECIEKLWWIMIFKTAQVIVTAIVGTTESEEIS